MLILEQFLDVTKIQENKRMTIKQEFIQKYQVQMIINSSKLEERQNRLKSKTDVLFYAISSFCNKFDELEFRLTNRRTYQDLTRLKQKSLLKNQALLNKSRFDFWFSTLSENHTEHISPDSELSATMKKQYNSLLTVVEMDVKRTFNLDKQFNKNDLHVLLIEGTRRLMGSVTYCQGMNYIGGMLVYQNLDPKLTLELYTLILQERMKELFDENLTYLKEYFYILDQLVQIYIPDLSQNFQVT